MRSDKNQKDPQDIKEAETFLNDKVQKILRPKITILLNYLYGIKDKDGADVLNLLTTLRVYEKQLADIISRGKNSSSDTVIKTNTSFVEEVNTKIKDLTNIINSINKIYDEKIKKYKLTEVEILDKIEEKDKPTVLNAHIRLWAIKADAADLTVLYCQKKLKAVEKLKEVKPEEKKKLETLLTTSLEIQLEEHGRLSKKLESLEDEIKKSPRSQHKELAKKVKSTAAEVVKLITGLPATIDNNVEWIRRGIEQNIDKRLLREALPIVEQTQKRIDSFKKIQEDSPSYLIQWQIDTLENGIQGLSLAKNSKAFSDSLNILTSLPISPEWNEAIKIVDKVEKQIDGLKELQTNNVGPSLQIKKLEEGIRDLSQAKNDKEFSASLKSLTGRSEIAQHMFPKEQTSSDSKNQQLPTEQTLSDSKNQQLPTEQTPSDMLEQKSSFRP